MRTTFEFPVYLKYYYVLEFKNLLKPRLIPLYFVSKTAAKRAIRENVRRNKRKLYSIYRGKKLKEAEFEYTPKRAGTWGHSKKYDYPKNWDRKKKRNHRILMRRRLRRMGLYTHIKPFKNIDTEPERIKLIHNRQIRANSPRTDAKAFGLERKNKNVRYIIVKKLPKTHISYLITLKVVKINIKNGNYSYITLNIFKTDVIRPYLMKEVLRDIDKLENKEAIINLYNQQLKNENNN